MTDWLLDWFLFTAYATRSCILRPNDNDGMWQEPYIDDCISQDLLDLKIQVKK